MGIVSVALERVRATETTCPVSGDTEWSVDDHLAMVPTGHTRDAVYYPSVVIICDVCGYTLLLNVFSLDIGEDLGLQPAESEDDGR